MKKSISIDSNKKSAFKLFSDSFYDFLNTNYIGYNDIIILCIGTDRATGDSLGPLIGYKLKNLYYPNITILGSLDKPVHAKNLSQNINYIYSTYDRPFIIAIDACLGNLNHIGYINMGNGSIKPGAGVNKNLQEVGNIYITGVVNFSGIMDVLVLQSTRLNVVMNMADIINSGIRYSFRRYFSKNKVV